MKPYSNHSDLQAEEDDENYFVSLSDLMTGVLFVFVILTTALALHYHLKAGELSDALHKTSVAQSEASAARGDAVKAKSDAVKAKGEAEQAAEAARDAKGKAIKVQEALDALAKVLREREQLRKEELQGLVARLREKHLTVELDETNGILRLPERLLFRTGEAQLQPDGESALALFAKEMLPVVRRGCGDSPLKWEAIYIEGHTDNVPIHRTEFASNWELSSARAIRTSSTLQAAEPALGMLKNHQGKAVIGISGYADQRPVADNDSDAGRQKNRRIDVRFVMAYPSKTEIEDMEKKLNQATQSIGNDKP